MPKKTLETLKRLSKKTWRSLFGMNHTLALKVIRKIVISRCGSKLQQTQTMICGFKVSVGWREGRLMGGLLPSSQTIIFKLAM